MAVTMSIDTTTDPIWMNSTSANGKFYDAVVVQVDYVDSKGNAATAFIPCFNWGAGYPAQFTAGSITLDRFYGNVIHARKAMQSKISKKVNEGYTTYSFTRTSYVPPKLRQKIGILVTSSLAIQNTATPAPAANQGIFVKPGKSQPAFTTPVPTDKRTEFVTAIESMATDILTCPDLDDAVVKLGKVKTLLAGARAELDQAADAVEMANAFVTSRLNR